LIARVAEAEDYTQITDLVSRAFKQPRLELNIVSFTINHDPNFQKGDLRVVEDNSRIVSVMMAIRRQLRVGTALVNGAIVAPVATHPEYQGKGYCSVLMRDAIRYMKAQDLDLSLLWGIPWLYPHYGYSSSMSRTHAFIIPEESKPVEGDLGRFRPLEESDLKQITSIYHANTSQRTCAEVRLPERWAWESGGSSVDFQVLEDRKGNVTGYCVFGKDWGNVCAHEVSVSNGNACGAVVNRISEVSKEKGLKEFYCISTPDHPFARFLYWHGGEIRLSRSGGAGMARVLNVSSLLTNMEKEFDRRLEHSELHNANCSLKIESDEGTGVLQLHRRKVTVDAEEVKADYELEISLSSLNPLITGFKGVKEFTEDPRVRIKGGKKALRLIEVLFPTGYPFGAHIPLFWE